MASLRFGYFPYWKHDLERIKLKMIKRGDYAANSGYMEKFHKKISRMCSAEKLS